MKNNYKWCVLGLLCCSFFFHQADRALFGLLTIPIQADLGLTDTQIGWVNTALFCTLAVTTPIAGLMGDRFSRKWIITFSLLFWSLMTAATGFVGGLVGLIFFRSIATGGGESFYGPSASALIASHHVATRSLAFSIHQSALYVGLMFSGAIVAAALAAFGSWRIVFMVFGGLGFLLGLVFVFALKDRPADAAAPSGKPDAPAGDKPNAPSVAAADKPTLGECLSAYVKNPAAICSALGFLAIVFANNAYMSWAPKFVARKFGLSVGAAGGGSMFYHYAAAFGAIFLGAFVTDRMVKRYPRFRLVLQMGALLAGAPMLALVGFAPSLVVTWAAMAGYGIFRGLFEANAHPSLFDVIAPRYRATAYGMTTFVVFIAGSFSPLMMGHLSDSYGVHGFEIGFAILGGCYVCGVFALLASFLFFFRRYRVIA